MSGAIEFLDNVLKGDVRRRVMLLVEDMPQDERMRKGNVIYRTRTRDVEDTLAQLLHDEQQAIAAAAIHLVESRKLWNLADDIEHVLAHRDPRDWYVFEAASWALAAHRMPAERRKELWQEPLPAVELADRLRRIPVFSFASVDELFRIAGLGRQVRYEAGRTLYERDTTPTTVQFLLEGRVNAVPAKGAAQAIDAPAPVAFEEMLEGSRDAGDDHGARAGDRAVADDRRVPGAAVRERGAGRGHLPHADAEPSRLAGRRPRRDLARPAAQGRTPACSRSIACCCCRQARCSRTPPPSNCSAWPRLRVTCRSQSAPIR